MGKKLQNKQPVLLCKKQEGSCSSSEGLSNVFDLWKNCSNQRLNLVLGLEHPKRDLRDKMETKKLQVDEGKRTVKTLMDEESFKEQSEPVLRAFSKKKQKSEKQNSNLSKEKKEAEFVNKALKKYLYKDRRNHHSQYFLDALTILKSNEELFSRLIQDPNSLLAKHIRNIQELHVEKERSNLVTKPKLSERASETKFQKKNMCNLVWGKIRSRYEYPSELRIKPRALKQVEISENLGCHCSFSLKNKNNVVEPLYFSFKTKSKFTKGDERKELKGCFKSNIVSVEEKMDKNFGSSFSEYSKGRDFDIVEEEGKRHLSERLMNSNQNKCFPHEESPTILGKILHFPQSRIFDLELDKLRNRLLDTKRDKKISSKTDGLSSADQTEKDLSQSGDFDILELPTSPSNTNDSIVEENIVSISSSGQTEDLECSGIVSTFQYQRLIAPLDYSSMKTDIVNLPSPVSVLEPFFLDDNNSPSSTTARQGNPPIQPMHIDFEQHTLMGSSPTLEIKSESSSNELDLISTYLEALLQASSSSWKELFLSWQSYSSNQFFNPNLINEVKLPLTEFYDPNMFFDSVNEAVSEVYHYFVKSSPFVSSCLLKPVLTETSIVNEIKRKVDIYFCPRVQPRTIEQLAGEDHVRLQTWMDITEDIEEITVQVVESVVEELIQEMKFEILF